MVLRRALPAFLCACVVLLAGCSDGSTEEEAGTGGASTGAEPTPSASPTTDGPEAGVEAADGKELEIDFVRLRVPKRWKTDEFVHNHDTASHRDSVSLIQLRQAGPVAPHPLDEQAKQAREGLREPGVKRRDDVTIADQDFYRLAGKDGSGLWIEEYGTLYQQQLVMIGFQLDPGLRPAERQRVIDSVFATWEWR